MKIILPRVYSVVKYLHFYPRSQLTLTTSFSCQKDVISVWADFAVVYSSCIICLTKYTTYCSIFFGTKMIFEWDSKKDKINRKTHGISFSTAKFVFNDVERWERFDSIHSEHEDRWQTIGLVDKVLFVVYTEQRETIRIISARMADENEQKVYNGERNIAGWTKAN